MANIGIREPKTRASEIVREVKGRGRRYVITSRGRPVALLVPIEQLAPEALAGREGATWEELTRLGQEIGERWQAPVSSAELLLASPRQKPAMPSPYTVDHEQRARVAPLLAARHPSEVCAELGL